ncbi:MAG: hypothetical protein WC889_05280 [Myxococcota bacterium]|jgi:hypothetical protein
MNETCEAYIRRAKLIGALYSIVPSLLWAVGLLLLNPFREVYLLRIALSLVLGGLSCAIVHDRCVGLWVARHSSGEGPAGVGDGMILGASIGMAAVLFPSLTTLIASNHIEEAKSYIIASWLSGALIGAIMGGVAAYAGRKYLDRDKG